MRDADFPNYPLSLFNKAMNVYSIIIVTSIKIGNEKNKTRGDNAAEEVTQHEEATQRSNTVGDSNAIEETMQ